MAIQVKFKCSMEVEDFIECESSGDGKVVIGGEYDDMPYNVILDITTAIKFAKTVRTEINKAKKELEDQNG